MNVSVIALLFASALWPFRPIVETPAPPNPASYVVIQGETYQCDRDDEGDYLFLGPDSLIGISPESCSAAFQEWRRTYGPNVKMLRA